jgi:hypothetical protein
LYAASRCVRMVCSNTERPGSSRNGSSFRGHDPFDSRLKFRHFYSRGKSNACNGNIWLEAGVSTPEGRDANKHKVNISFLTLLPQREYSHKETLYDRTTSDTMAVKSSR